MSNLLSLGRCAAGLLLVAVLGTMPRAHAEAPYSFDTTPGQLPKAIVPLDYTFRVVPDFKKLTFAGSETVRIQVRTESREIILNALQLQIKSAKLSGPSGPAQTLKPQLDEQKQTLRFALDAPLAPGEYRLAIDYTGVINAQPQGLFYDRYPSAKGQQILIGTQLESTDARRLLPCWDEPAFRASFQLTVDLPKDLHAYSNTPIESTAKRAGGLQRIAFQRTPKMASYLVVLVAGHLERLKGEQDGVEIGIVTTEGKQASAAYALQASKDILHFYNDYFGIPFPLPKLDQIAIPGGFGGAMENWGGITYNEAILLFDSSKSSESTKQDVYSVIAHEMAHQWFGDLVTTAWWDNLWLNEGFASWMGTKATDHFNPGWQVWLQANGERERAMGLDARASTHPIQQAIANESDAADAFDDITYLKGQSFLRMLETWLGPDTFRDGIRTYMATHQYSNTTTADLWAALEKASGKPVARMASTWTEEPGFPMISVDAPCKDGKRQLTLAQQQFHSDGAADAGRRWAIPVAIGSVSAPFQSDYVLLDSARMSLDRVACGETVLIDPASVGYYRINYSAPDLALLAASLPQLPDAARLKLLSDSWALTTNGTLPLSALIDLLGRIGDEPQRTVWGEAAGDLNALDVIASDAPVRPRLRQYAIALLRPPFQRLGWTPKSGEDDETRQLRAQLASNLGDFGDAETVAEAQQRFRAFLKDPKSLPTSLSDAVIGLAGRYADAATWAQLRGLLDRAVTTEERQRYLFALCAAKDPVLAARALELALDDRIPPSLAIDVPAVVSGHEHVALAWAWTRQNGAALLKRSTQYERNHVLGSVLHSSADAALAADLEAYAATLLPPEALTETHRDVDAIRYRAQRKARLLPQLEAALPAS